MNGFGFNPEPKSGKVISDMTYNATWIAGDWTADPDTNVLTCSEDHGLVVGAQVSFNAGTGELPIGISAEPEYYFVCAVPSTKTLNVSLTRTGSTIDITAAGTVGWKIRKAYAPTSTISLDFSLYNEVDIFASMRCVSKATNGYAYPFLALAPNTVKVFLNDVNHLGTSYIIAPGVQGDFKYFKTLAHYNIRKLASALYAVQIDIGGICSNNLDYSTPTPYTKVLTGIITTADITGVRVAEGYSQSVMNGDRIIAVRR